MARPSRQAMYADDPTFLWKVILRIFAIVLALVGIGTIAWALIWVPSPSLAQSSDNYYSSYIDSDPDEDQNFQDFVFLPWSFIPLSLSIKWNLANIATLLARSRPIHPGANVGCDLVLWLLFALTGTFATFGAAEYIDSYIGGLDDFSAGDDDYTYNNGTSAYDNSTAIACGGFTSCAAEKSYSNALQHKGIVITVGCAMQFAVLLIHFALFISACRYTHARRHKSSSNKAKAITAEATEMARKMVADLTSGPNAQLQPLLQQPQEQGMQHEQQPMQQQADGAYQPRWQEPIQQHSTAQQQQMARENAMERRYEGTRPMSAPGESSRTAAGKRPRQPLPDIMIENPTRLRDSQTHPVLRDGGSRDSISYA